LRGNRTEKVERSRHDDLPTFGVGRDIDQKGWQSVFRQLAARGIISIDHTAYGALKLEESSRPVLQGQQPVEFRRDPVRTRRQKTAAAAPDPLASPEEEALFQSLRAERLRLAREQGVPPYVIFHDTSLLEMARRRPSSVSDMGDIPGVGSAKIARYGDAFLAVIAAAD
ncbi:MAG: HRDC domain-containing protein, partial [Amphiplicatus sp.]